MGQFVHCLVAAVLVEARRLETAGPVVPHGTEDPDLCLEVWLHILCEDVALEWGDGADGVHLEELIGTEAVPGEGELVLEDGAGGEGEEGVLVDEGAAAWWRRLWVAVRVDGVGGVGVFVVFVVAVVEAVEGGPGADGGGEHDGGHGALCVAARGLDEVAFCEEPELCLFYL